MMKTLKRATGEALPSNMINRENEALMFWLCAQDLVRAVAEGDHRKAFEALDDLDVIRLHSACSSMKAKCGRLLAAHNFTAA